MGITWIDRIQEVENMNRFLIEVGFIISILGVCSFAAALSPSLSSNQSFSTFLRWYGAILIGSGILVAILGAVKGTQQKPVVKEVQQEPVMEIGTPFGTLSFTQIVTWFLTIMGIMTLILASYSLTVILGSSFFSVLPYEFKMLMILYFLVAFSVGLTEIIVSWLYSESKASRAS